MWSSRLDGRWRGLPVSRDVRRGPEVLVADAVLLPPSPAQLLEHVELGYATTVHRTQGLTVDTAHAVIEPDTATRELLYVAMTRAAVANHVHVGVEEDRDPEHGHHRINIRRHELGDDHGRGHCHSIDRGYGIGL